MYWGLPRELRYLIMCGLAGQLVSRWFHPDIDDLDEDTRDVLLHAMDMNNNGLNHMEQLVINNDRLAQLKIRTNLSGA